MKIEIMRHGLAEKRQSGQKDIDRPLMESGKEFIPRLGEFDAVFSSPAKRCIETATLASGQEPKIIRSLSTHLWDGKVSKLEGWELVEKCYYLPNGKMTEVPLAIAWQNLSKPEKKAWKSITSDAMNTIFHSFGNVWDRVLICTHQLHAQAIALEILEKRGSDDLKAFIRNMYLPPGGTITLNIKADIVRPFRGRRGGIFFW